MELLGWIPDFNFILINTQVYGVHSLILVMGIFGIFTPPAVKLYLSYIYLYIYYDIVGVAAGSNSFDSVGTDSMTSSIKSCTHVSSGGKVIIVGTNGILSY